MSSNFQKLEDACNNNPSLVAKLTQDEDLDSFIKAAKDAGFDISIEDLESHFENVSQSQDGELTDAQLQHVSGGGLTDWLMSIFSFRFIGTDTGTMRNVPFRQR